MGAGVNRRDRTPPTTPTNLRITATTDTTVSLAWNASTDNSGNFSYRVTESSAFNTYTVAVPQDADDDHLHAPVAAADVQVHRLRRRRRGQPLRRQQHGQPHGPGRRHTADAGAAVDRDPDQSGAGQLLLDGVGRQRKPGLLHDLRQRDRAGFFFSETHYWAFDLTPSATYEFQVVASDVFGNAVEGNTVTITMPSTTDTVPPTAPTNLSGDTLDNEIHMNWGLSTDNADPQSQILYEFYLNGVANRGDVLFGSSGLVYCREASGLTTVVARAVDSSGNRSAPSNEIIVQCP